MITAYIGLGSNQGEPRAQIDQAFGELDGLPATRLAARSPLYRSAPHNVEAEQALADTREGGGAK